MPRPVMYLMSAGSCPPSDKRWLLSSMDMLHADQENNSMWKKKWASAEGKFPGAKASLEDKLEWLYWVNSGELEESQFELLFDHTRPHDTQAVANEILYDNCTPKVNFEVLVNRNCVDQLSSVLDDENTFLKSALRRRSGPRRGPSESSAAAFLEWLKTAPAGTTVHATPLPTAPNTQSTKVPDYYARANTCDYVLLASTQLERDTDVDDALKAITKQLGLKGYALKVVGSRRSIHHHGVMTDKIGEMVHFPSEQNGDSTVAVELFVRHNTKKPNAPSAFEEELNAKKEASPDKAVLVIEKGLSKRPECSDDDDKDDDKVVTPENFHVLWLRKEFHKYCEDIRMHLQNGEGECEEIKKRLDKGNTDSGNLRADMVNSHLSYIKYEFEDGTRDERVSLKFCRVLALIQVIVNDQYWMFDNECPDEVEKLVKDIAAYCRTFLGNKYDNQTLGLGCTAEAADGESSREALYELLRFWQRALESKNPNFLCIKANFIPGHSRQPKRKAPEADN